MAVFSEKVIGVNRFVLLRSGGNYRFVSVATFEDIRSLQYDEIVDYGVSTTFQVDRTWKGISRQVQNVITDAGGGDCGYPFERDKTYMVYAYIRQRVETIGQASVKEPAC